MLFPKSHGALWLLVIGPIWAAVYYGIFSFAIRRFNLLTPGREVEDEAAKQPARAPRRPVRAAARPRLRRPLEHRQPRRLHHAAARQARRRHQGQPRQAQGARRRRRGRRRRRHAGDLRHAEREPEDRDAGVPQDRRARGRRDRGALAGEGAGAASGLRTAGCAIPTPRARPAPTSPRSAARRTSCAWMPAPRRACALSCATNNKSAKPRSKPKASPLSSNSRTTSPSPRRPQRRPIRRRNAGQLAA